MQDNYILMFNVLLYVITLIVYIRKNRLVSLGTGVLFLYSMSAYMALELYYNPLSNLEKPTIGPLFYLYIFLLLFFLPLMRFDVNRIDFQSVCKKEMFFVDKLSIIIFMITLLALIGNFRNIDISSLLSVSSLADNYLNTNEGLEDYSKSALGIFNYISMLQFAVSDLSIFFLGVYLVRQNKSKIILLGLSVLMTIVISMTKGARAGLVSIIFSLFFLCVVFYPYLRDKYKIIARNILIAIGSFVAIVFVAITIGRFVDNSSTEVTNFFLQNYLGQSMIKFDNYGLDANGIRYGDRTAPIIRILLGLGTSTNFYERRELYSNMLIDDSYFYTFVGDFTLDYGPVWGALIMLLMICFFNKRLKLKQGDCYRLSHLLLLYVLFQWCMYGFTLWPFAEKMGNVKLIVFLIVYSIFRYQEINNLRLWKKKLV